MKLGELLKNEREKRGWTLRQTENKLKSKNIEYSHTSIKRLENGENEKIPIKVLSALSDFFSLNKIDIFNLAGASLNVEDEKIEKLTKREKMQLDEILNSANFYYNDKNVSEEDKKNYMILYKKYFLMQKQKIKEKNRRICEK